MSFFDSFGAAATNLTNRFGDGLNQFSNFAQSTLLPLAQSAQQIQASINNLRPGRPTVTNVGNATAPGQVPIVSPASPAQTVQRRAIPWALIAGVVVVGYIVTRKK